MRNNEALPRFRHELKYRITEGESQILISRLKDVIQRDAHARDGKYLIRSLYFDDFWNTAYEEKLMGTASREKYRIRFYDYSDKVIKLECKHKQGNYIYKESAAMNRSQVQDILDARFLLLKERPEPLCQRFYYQCTSRFMRPKVIVDYEREPFVWESGDVRITFDRNICEAGYLGDLFDSNLTVYPVMEHNQLIMEVKYTEFLPDLIRLLLPTGGADYTAASKYVMCCDKNLERYW